METESFKFILLNIGFAIHEADWNYKNVSSPFARIYLVKEGNAKLHLKDKVQELTPGHLYMIPPYTLHSYECDGYYSLYYIHIYESDHSIQRIMEDYNYPTEVEALETDELLIERLMTINPERQLKEYDPSVYDNFHMLTENIRRNQIQQPADIFETQGIIMQLFSRFLRNVSIFHDITDDRILRILHYIRKNIDKEINIQELAEMCCLTKDHFIRLFKKEMNNTPLNYINQKKIEKAQLLLLTEDMHIKDIAYSLAFYNITYFSRIFKKFAGCSPTEYRENNYF